VTGGLLVNYTRANKPRPKPAPVANTPPWQAPLAVYKRDPREVQLNLEQRRLEFIRNASRELDLTPEQRGRIDKIIRDSQEHTHEVWARVAPEMRKELAEVKDQIRAELTPEQKRRFEEMLKRPRKPEEFLPGNRQPRRTQPNVPATPQTNP
jgi:hypothetical protein